MWGKLRKNNLCATRPRPEKLFHFCFFSGAIEFAFANRERDVMNTVLKTRARLVAVRLSRKVAIGNSQTRDSLGQG